MLSMPFKTETYRILIASPSDLEEERQAVTEAINDWNAQHAASESTVLLPVKWETHATPRAGETTPQTDLILIATLGQRTVPTAPASAN